MKLYKRVFIEAAELIANGEKNFVGASLYKVFYQVKNPYIESFDRMFNLMYVGLGDQGSVFFGSFVYEENQLARSIALLLAAEVLGGTDGDIF
jgi:hypothetical protein